MTRLTSRSGVLNASRHPSRKFFAWPRGLPFLWADTSNTVRCGAVRAFIQSSPGSAAVAASRSRGVESAARLAAPAMRRPIKLRRGDADIVYPDGRCEAIALVRNLHNVKHATVGNRGHVSRRRSDVVYPGCRGHKPRRRDRNL